MNIQDIIFKILRTDGRLWIKYSITKQDYINPNQEQIEIKSRLISAEACRIIQKEGFEIIYVKTEKIDTDAYTNVLFARKYVNANGTNATP